MDPDGSLMDGGLAPNHGSHPAAIQCWTIRIRSERAHHHQRRYHSKQSPELWYTSYHWTAKPLCNRQPVVLYKVHGDSSHPTTKRLSSNLDRSALDFFFSFVSFTARNGRWSLYRSLQVWVGPRSFEVCRSSGVQQRPFVSTLTEPDDFGRDSLFVHNFVFSHFGRPKAIFTAIITNSAKF